MWSIFDTLILISGIIVAVIAVLPGNPAWPGSSLS